MTPEQASAVARLPSHWRRFVRCYYRLPHNVNLSHALRRAGVGYIELTLMLARRPHTRRALEALLGRPVAVGPRCLLRWRFNSQCPAVRRDIIWRDRRIAWINPSFVSNRYDVILRTVACRTPRGLHQQGIPWRALQHMLERGHLRVEDAR